MALAKLPSAAIEGIGAYSVSVEVDVSSGLPGFTVVGLADKAIEESKERVRSALRHSGFNFPLSRVTVHLAPSEKHKSAVYFDLPIALALLLSDDQIKKCPKLDSTIFLGGLSLDGGFQSVTGALILVEWAKLNGYARVVLPSRNYAEAKLVKGIEIVPIDNFRELIGYLEDEVAPKIPDADSVEIDDVNSDWMLIQGQEKAKRSAIISAAGGHNLLLSGPPGAGKSLLAKGIRSIMPTLEDDELLEVVKIQSLAGELKYKGNSIDIARPFRSPHHSASAISIIGGGSQPRPGEITLAHLGVLLLDELPEYPRQVLEALRQPLEDGEINVSRIKNQVRYPAQFILVATMNPCPCGYYNTGIKECRCSASEVDRYRKKISGPILDRLDIFLSVQPVSIDALEKPTYNIESFNKIKHLVKSIRQKQQARNHKLNSALNPREINELIAIDQEAKDLLRQACEKLAISGRGYYKIVKIAQTIADLSGDKSIGKPHIAEAIQYRQVNF